MQKTIGGDRLGSGSKMKVHLSGYERSTHDVSYTWRSSMSAGTLVPFMAIPGLPGSTFDITLQMDGKTHPTIGPLFGSHKVQLDIFVCPHRLYIAALHNNKLNIGLHMENVYLPNMTFSSLPEVNTITDLDNSQINPSCILNYLGLRGFGRNKDTTPKNRNFQALKIISYWDIYKQYYANKQEQIGAVIHTPTVIITETIDTITVTPPTGSGSPIPKSPTTTSVLIGATWTIQINYTGTPPLPNQIQLNTYEHGLQTVDNLFTSFTDSGTVIQATFNSGLWGSTHILSWQYLSSGDINNGKPGIATFPLENIDNLREAILAAPSTSPFSLSGWAANPGPEGQPPYIYLFQGFETGNQPCVLSSQEGLGLKTYQSDLFNNWLETEWLTGTNGINEITKIDVTGGALYIDTLILQRKVYDMLNKIYVSGGTYNDWIEAAYDHIPYSRCESPMYMGGLIKEMVFQEVISNSASTTPDGQQPLGQLAGRGVMSQKHKGGHITIKCDEHCYIMGIVSLTPRIDYSQGNKWDMHLQTMNDWHKPGLDQIGFQDDITEDRCWWDTVYNLSTESWEQKSVGKQPAWLKYMTDVNRTYGNFAIAKNEMFMTLNRNFEMENDTIKDLTTYIDPSKYNNIFAERKLDAQNFWIQIGCNITARHKMSAKIMPNL